MSGDGGCVKYVLRRGDGLKPRAGQTVNAHYVGKLTNGTQFDASRSRGKVFSFPLGARRVILGWDVGFASMSVGEKAVLVLSPKYGYGDAGAGGIIPGGATLLFEVRAESVSPEFKAFLTRAARGAGGAHVCVVRRCMRAEPAQHEGGVGIDCSLQPHAKKDVGGPTGSVA